MTDKKTDAWPFQQWLKIAVTRFSLSPQEFWSTSVADWLSLTAGENTPVMGRSGFDALSAKYPDELTSIEMREINDAPK